jgi:hypothetical protein
MIECIRASCFLGWFLGWANPSDVYFWKWMIYMISVCLHDFLTCFMSLNAWKRKYWNTLEMIRHGNGFMLWKRISMDLKYVACRDHDDAWNAYSIWWHVWGHGMRWVSMTYALWGLSPLYISGRVRLPVPGSMPCKVAWVEPMSPLGWAHWSVERRCPTKSLEWLRPWNDDDVHAQCICITHGMSICTRESAWFEIFMHDIEMLLLLMVL